MRIFLMLLGAAIAIGALALWVGLSALASSWRLDFSGGIHMQWLTEEALLMFWLPFTIGVGIAFIGWKRP